MGSLQFDKLQLQSRVVMNHWITFFCEVDELTHWLKWIRLPSTFCERRHVAFGVEQVHSFLILMFLTELFHLLSFIVLWRPLWSKQNICSIPAVIKGLKLFWSHSNLYNAFLFLCPLFSPSTLISQTLFFPTHHYIWVVWVNYLDFVTK